MSPDDWIVDFPTLGDLWDAWITAHCTIPDGYDRGHPLHWSDWQFWCAAKFGQIRAGLHWDGKPLANEAFEYRRMQVMAPQKTGKGPWAASMTLIQAVGPAEFYGFAEEGESYRCSDWGCDCGFEYVYLPGDAKGRPHPSPLIQLTATSEDQVDNTYRPLQSMITMGPLSKLMAPRGEFVRILGGIGGDDADRIDVVTANANSRVGNPISFAIQDETGLWTKQNRMVKLAEAQRRGLAGMAGRSIETTNAYDSSEDSVAQRTYEAAAKDVYRFYIPPPPNLRWERKTDRMKILETVYRGSPWVRLGSVLQEAEEISIRDPEQAERFFGNRITYSSGTWLPTGLWEEHYGMGTEPA